MVWYAVRGRGEMADVPCRVFVSHGSHDRWLAAQIGRCVREAGAEAFLDETHIPKGENFERRIREELGRCDELIALFTPWSSGRSWVWVEIGVGWFREVPVVAVFYGMTPEDLERSGQGKAILGPLNALELNDLDDYLRQLSLRTRRTSP